MRQQIIVDALDSCLKIIYEQRYLAQKNKALTLSHTLTNMAGEKNDILCDE
jgi:hypothetical protein